MSDASTIRPRPTGKAALWLLVVAALALVIGANAHLVYVALTSQPACVAHLRPGVPTSMACRHAVAHMNPICAVGTGQQSPDV